MTGGASAVVIEGGGERGAEWLTGRVPRVSAAFLAYGGLQFWGDLGPRVVEVSFSFYFFVFLSI
jgi:hypothetical protein